MSHYPAIEHIKTLPSHLKHTHTHTKNEQYTNFGLSDFPVPMGAGQPLTQIKLLEYHKADINIKDTKFRASDVDIISTQILTKYHPALLEDSAPLQTIGDGNCLYRAISKLLTRHEESHKLIRLEVALELIIFSDRYDAKSKKKLEFLNDSRIVTSDIHKLIKDAIRLGSFSEMAHMYAASAAIKKPIRSYYPPQAHPELSSEPFTRTIVGRGAKQSNPAGCKKKNYTKKQNPDFHSNNIADNFQEIENLVMNNDAYIRSVIRTNGKTPCIILYSDEQIADLKTFCCSGLTVLGVDKTRHLICVTCT